MVGTGVTRKAKHTRGVRTSVPGLLVRFALHAKWRHFINAPSNLGWMVLRRKYDAFTTDAAYDEKPSSWLGPLGWWADRRVRNYPLHVALRERLAYTSAEIGVAIDERLATRETVAVLTAPAGLCRDIVTAARWVEHGALPRVRFTAVDIDDRGDVIPEAQARCGVAQLDIEFERADVFAARSLRDGRSYDVVNCIGLACWLTLDELERLLRLFRARVGVGATLLIDNFAWHAHSALGDDLEIETRYHDRDAFVDRLSAAGFSVERERVTRNGVNTLFVARAV